MALFLPPLARGELGDAALDVARQRQRRPAHRVEVPAPLDAHQNVEAAAARGLGPAGEPHVSQHGVDHMRHLTYLRPLDAGHGIEVHAQLVGMVQVLGADRMRVQLEAREVGEPRQRGGVARHDFFGGPAGGEAQRHYLDPRRPGLGCALLVEELARDTVRVADQDVGPAARPAQSAFGDGEVVPHEVELCVFRLREQHLARIRDRELAAGHHEPFVLLAAHPGGRTTGSGDASSGSGTHDG